MGLGPEITSGYCKLPLISPAPSYRPSTGLYMKKYIRPLSSPNYKKSTLQSTGNLSLQTPLYYGHLSKDSLFGPRNAKNHTFPTSIMWTPL